MIDGLSVASIIPARGGSKSIKQKNLQYLGNKPLLMWPIECSLKTGLIDRTIVSTDDDEICEVAKRGGAEVYRRPNYLATDDALVIDTIRHLHSQLTLEGKPVDIFVLLEPTSPFRTPELIGRCLRKLIDKSYDSLATFHEAEIHPERIWKIEDEHPAPFINGGVAWRPRQSLSPAYQLNGAVYAFYPDRLPVNGVGLLFANFGAEIMEADNIIDIDTNKDLAIANALLKS